jgi:hypothetical protein
MRRLGSFWWIIGRILLGFFKLRFEVANVEDFHRALQQLLEFASFDSRTGKIDIEASRGYGWFLFFCRATAIL